MPDDIARNRTTPAWASRSVAQLAELTHGVLAEMRALIFELRPGALVAEGLVGALRKTGAALSAREEVDIVVDGPQERPDLAPDAEEHLYRIAVEAMNNLVKHARAGGPRCSSRARRTRSW